MASWRSFVSICVKMCQIQHRKTSEYMGYRPAGAGEDRGLSETLGEGDG